MVQILKFGPTSEILSKFWFWLVLAGFGWLVDFGWSGWIWLALVDLGRFRLVLVVLVGFAWFWLVLLGFGWF